MAESVTPEGNDTSPHESGSRSQKRQKIAIACDVCRAKKIRCDGTRPVCTPCRKRDRELLCQYSLDSKTPSGAPSKGYVHHLELKLRELQAEKGGSGSPPTAETTYQPNHAGPQTPQQEVWRQPGHPGIQRHNSSAGHANTLPPLTEIAERNGATGISSWNISQPQATHVQQPNPHYRRSSDAVPQHVPFPPRLDMGHAVSWRPPVKQETDPTNEDVDFSSSSAQVFTRQITLAIDRKLGTRSVPLLPGNRPRASSNHRKKSISVDYVLPPKDQADYFAHTYWTLVHPMFPILDRQAFHKAYADLCSLSSPVDMDDPSMLAQINLIFALGCQHSDTFGDMDQRESTAKIFFDRATELLNLDLIDIGSLETVQCFLLMTHYLQSTKNLARNWMLVGIAVRMAQALRLHRAETSAQQDPKRRELYRRVWHGCLFMDRIFSMTFDRPTMMDGTAMSQVPLPLPIDDEYLPGSQPADQPSSMDYYIQSLQLIRLMDAMLQDVQTVERESKRPDDQYELLFGHPEDVEVVSILKHDRIMMAFSRKLPRHLQVDAPETRRNELFIRQANVLRARYLHCRILLFRPVLSRFCLAQNDLTVSSVAPKMDESLPQRLALAASTLCVRAAHENIDLIYTNLDAAPSMRALGSLPTSWFCVLYLYTAATVLQAARLRPIVEMGVSDYSINTSWSHAMESLDRLTRVNTMAKRCLAALEILSNKVTTSTTSRSSGPSRAEPASAPAGMESAQGPGAEGQGMHPGPPPPQSPWASAGSGGVGQEDGVIPPRPGRAGNAGNAMGGMDLDGYDFDIGDMTWLTTTRILTWM